MSTSSNGTEHQALRQDLLRLLQETRENEGHRVDDRFHGLHAAIRHQRRDRLVQEIRWFIDNAMRVYVLESMLREARDLVNGTEQDTYVKIDYDARRCYNDQWSADAFKPLDIVVNCAESLAWQAFWKTADQQRWQEAMGGQQDSSQAPSDE